MDLQIVLNPEYITLNIHKLLFFGIQNISNHLFIMIETFLLKICKNFFNVMEVEILNQESSNKGGL